MSASARNFRHQIDAGDTRSRFQQRAKRGHVGDVRLFARNDEQPFDIEEDLGEAPRLDSIILKCGGIRFGQLPGRGCDCRIALQRIQLGCQFAQKISRLVALERLPDMRKISQER